MSNAAMEEAAFEMFAQAYPHEAAEADWEKFVKFTRKICPEPNISEAEIRRLLNESSGT
jgi:hypothetical protein